MVSQLSYVKLAQIASHITKIELCHGNYVLVERSLGWIAHHANLFDEQETEFYIPQTLSDAQQQRVWEFIAAFKQHLEF